MKIGSERMTKVNDTNILHNYTVRWELMGAADINKFKYLEGHFNSELECRNGELGVRPRRYPESEFRAGRLRAQIIAEVLELVHPVRHQVAVEQHDPGARARAFPAGNRVWIIK